MYNVHIIILLFYATRSLISVCNVKNVKNARRRPPSVAQRLIFTNNIPSSSYNLFILFCSHLLASAAVASSCRAYTYKHCRCAVVVVVVNNGPTTRVRTESYGWARYAPTRKTITQKFVHYTRTHAHSEGYAGENFIVYACTQILCAR